MMFKIRLLMFLLVVALAFTASTASAKELVGKQAPGFSLTDQHGKSHTLSEYSGKTVVLEWTNPGCPFVVRHYEAGTMKRLAEAGAKDGVVWLAINSSHFTNHEESKSWASKHGHTFPTLLDREGKIGQAYGAKTTPQMFVIDGKGIIRYQGAIDSDAWVKDPDAENYVSAALADLKAGVAVKTPSVKPYGCSVKYKR